jgi:hypothetical protein
VIEETTEFVLDKLIPSDVIGVDFSMIPADLLIGPGVYDFSDIYCARDKERKCVFFYLGALRDLREYLAFYYVLIINKTPGLIESNCDGSFNRITAVKSASASGWNLTRSSLDNVTKSAYKVLHTLEGSMKAAFVDAWTRPR